MGSCRNNCAPLCERCTNYTDDLHEKNQGYAGHGICGRKKIKVAAADFCELDFECLIHRKKPSKSSGIRR